jgi:hypothetical protein
MDTKYAQVSTEFFVIVGFAMLVLVIILGFMAEDMSQASYKKEVNAMTDLGYYVQNEILVASQVNDGYSRVFTLPEKKDGVSYNITTYSNSTIILTSQHGVVREFLTPSFIGNFTQGENKIDSLGGIVYVNVI